MTIVAELDDLPEPGKKEVASWRHEALTAHISCYLSNFVHDDAAGYILGTNAEYCVGEAQLLLQPDVSFVSKAKLPKPTEDDMRFGPDLAVEVVGNKDTIFGLEEKIVQYQQAGVGLVWIVRPVLKLVEVHRLGQNKPTLLGIEDELEGESVLPGFKLAVKALFE